jgi:hypothetical protein
MSITAQCQLIRLGHGLNEWTLSTAAATTGFVPCLVAATHARAIGGAT